MYSAEVRDIMEKYFMSKEYADWNKNSKERFKFDVIIKYCKEGIPKYIEIIIDIISKCTEPEKDPELKFDMLTQLELIIENDAIQDCVRSNSQAIVKKILVQSLVWRAGKPSIKIRKAALVVFTKILQKKLIGSEELYKNYPEIIASLKTCLDDDWAPDLRLTSIHFLKLLINTIGDHLDQIELSNLYPILLTRLDDAQDPIRIQTTEALKNYFSCKNMYMSDSTFEYVSQTLFVHLDDKNEEVQLAVFKCLEYAGTVNPKIVLQEVGLSKQALKSKPKQKFPRLCEKLIEILQSKQSG